MKAKCKENAIPEEVAGDGGVEGGRTEPQVGVAHGRVVAGRAKALLLFVQAQQHSVHVLGAESIINKFVVLTESIEIIKTRFGSRGFSRPTFRQTCTSGANHEDMDSLFPFLTKWEAHIIQLNFFLVH